MNGKPLHVSSLSCCENCDVLERSIQLSINKGIKKPKSITFLLIRSKQDVHVLSVPRKVAFGVKLSFSENLLLSHLYQESNFLIENNQYNSGMQQPVSNSLESFL